jgi:S-adenosylmethionine hydrolase
MARAIISLTTDFGTADHFVGTMKGVIFSILPEAAIADISHAIEAFDILGGALTIAAAAPYYRTGTVHVVVVDPGVGSARRPIVARVDQQFFVAPDNGVLTLIFERAKDLEVRHVTNDNLFLKPVSHTFHGRDIFAPAAAWLAKGTAFEEFGPLITDFVRLDIPKPVRIDEKTIRGSVLKVDRFGNLLTNLNADQIEVGFELHLGDVVINRVASHYAEGVPGELFLILGSSGFYEISTCRRSAADTLGARAGSEFLVKVRD